MNTFAGDDMSKIFSADLKQKLREQNLFDDDTFIYNESKGAIVHWRELQKYPDDCRDVLVF